MSAYEKLSPAVKTVVDRQALVMAGKDGITVDQAREVIAARVRILPTRPTPRGH